MMRLLLVVWLAWALPASASPLTSAAWVPYTEPGYWSGGSYDGPDCDLGHWLTGTPGCAVLGFYTRSPHAQPLLLGSGAAAWAWQGIVEVTLEGGWTAWVDEVGWCSLAAPAVKYPLFLTTMPVGTTAPAGQAQPWAFYFATPAGLWTSDSLDAGRTHAALAALPSAWLIGWEDRSPGGDWDYQDAILRVRDVPEPSSGWLLLGGLALLARLRW